MPIAAVYLETSVISYLTARESRDVVIASRQALARRWWDSRRHDFDLVTSQAVIDEARLGDAEAAARRLNALEGIPLVEASPASITLAEVLLRRLSLPSHVAADAAHIALAAANGIEYLLTWNCTHIANAALRPMIEHVCRSHGFEPPIICTPEELLDAPTLPQDPAGRQPPT